MGVGFPRKKVGQLRKIVLLLEKVKTHAARVTRKRDPITNAVARALTGPLSANAALSWIQMNRSLSLGRISSVAFGFLEREYLYPRMIAAGMPSSACPITSSAAEASSSATAVCFTLRV